jgi:hypothetical protein
MGFELDRLMRQYGVATPTLPAEAAPEYKEAYQRRLEQTPMYLQEQFQPGTSTAPPAVTFSTAQRYAVSGANPNMNLDVMNRNIRDWFAANPGATEAQIRAAQQEWGVSDLDIRNAIGAARPRGSTAYRYATSPTGIGLSAMNENIRRYFAQNPNATPAEVAAEQARWGTSNEDIYRATGSYWGRALTPAWAGGPDPLDPTKPRVGPPTPAPTPRPTPAPATYQSSPERQFARLGLEMPPAWNSITDPIERINILNNMGVTGAQLGQLGYSAEDIAWMEARGLNLDPTQRANAASDYYQSGYHQSDAYTPTPAPVSAPTPAPAPLTSPNVTAPAQQQFNDVGVVMPADWATRDSMQRIDYLNSQNITPQHLAYLGYSPNDIQWMVANGLGGASLPASAPAPAYVPPAYVPPAYEPPAYVPPAPPALAPTSAPDLYGLDTYYTPPTYQPPAPAPAPTSAPDLYDLDTYYAPAPAPAPAPAATPQEMATQADLTLPSGWNDYNAAQKIGYFNQQGITGAQLAQAGVGQGDIDWMRGQGYKFAKGGAVRFFEGGLNAADERADFAELAERYGTAPPQEQVSAPAPAQPGVAVAAQPMDLNAMLARYMQPGASSYGAELAEARGRARAETEAFNKMLQDAIKGSGEGGGPSKSEMYFRLAAAFADPGKTGSFGEGLGRAAGAVAEQKKAEREARRAAARESLQLGLTAQQARMTGAREDVSSLRQLAGEEMKDKRTVTAELLKEWTKRNDPVSTAGKQAQDEGLKPGTPQFQARVREISELAVEKANAQIQATVAGMSVAAANLALGQARFTQQQTEARRLTPQELTLKTETEDMVNQTMDAYSTLKQALTLNPNTFDTSLPDLAQRKILEAAGSKDRKLIDTRTMENLLEKAALSQLKSTFPGAISNDERKALMDTQGLGAKSVEERKRIMQNAMEALKKIYGRSKQRLNEINQGLYREVGTPTAGGLE